MSSELIKNFSFNGTRMERKKNERIRELEKRMKERKKERIRE
jgi:hypothetical protein